MRLHHRSRVIAIRLVIIFIVSFGLSFFVLNMRFVEKNVQYWAAPQTIRVTGEDIYSLPLARSLSDIPLPNQAALIIDSIGVHAPIVFGTPDNNDLVYDQLENGVVHYSSTTKPGMPGTAIVLGHSSAYPWYRGDYGAVFALLSKLKKDDFFYVRYADDRTFKFRMKEAIVFNPFSDGEKLAALEETPGSNIILLSCYPVGTNYKRIAVLAELVTE